MNPVLAKIHVQSMIDAIKQIVPVAVTGLVISLAPALALAQEDGPQDILIRNVTLMDPTGKTEDRIVNILIRDRKLDVITEDRISRDEAELVINANRGYILGKLEVGELPNFMILSDDPRENFDVLLDTRVYARFAVHEGVVVRNRLLDEVDENPEDEPKKTGWLAYTPPPLAIPMNYADTSKWNRWETKYVSGIFLAAMFLDRMHWLSQDTASLSQHGDLDSYDGGEIRGFRFGAVGTLNMFEKPWVYTIFGATNAFDNVADAMLPSRNVGVVWNGSSPEKYSSWAFGVFNDWFDADQDFKESATQYVGRFTWAPLHSDDDSNLVHLGVGYRYSNAKEGFRYVTEPEFNQSPVFVDTGLGTETGFLPADRLETYNLELSWRKGPFWLASEYTRTNVKSPALGDPTFDGYWVAVSWILSGEMRAYNTKSGVFGGVPVSRSVYQNGKGAWELTARWSNVDLNDGLVRGGNMDIASLGMTWWLTPFFGVNANYRYIWNELDGREGTSSGFNGRLIIMLE
jgi:phosphate-selective porin OprO/OprP